jgi:hypothetical protein
MSFPLFAWESESKRRREGIIEMSWRKINEGEDILIVVVSAVSHKPSESSQLSLSPKLENEHSDFSADTMPVKCSRLLPTKIVQEPHKDRTKASSWSLSLTLCLSLDVGSGSRKLKKLEFEFWLLFVHWQTNWIRIFQTPQCTNKIRKCWRDKFLEHHEHPRAWLQMCTNVLLVDLHNS